MIPEATAHPAGPDHTRDQTNGSAGMTSSPKEKRHLLDLVDDLRSSDTAGDLDLPTIAVLASDLRAKRSIIDELTGCASHTASIHYNRCPTEYRLSHDSLGWHCQVYIRTARGEARSFGQAIFDPLFLAETVWRAQIEAVAAQPLPAEPHRSDDGRSEPQGHSQSVVCVCIRGPSCVDLSFIDLPAFIQGVDELGRPSRPCDDANALQIAESYVRQEACSIVLVSNASDPIEADPASTLARRLDPEARRTTQVVQRNNDSHGCSSGIWSLTSATPRNTTFSGGSPTASTPTKVAARKRSGVRSLWRLLTRGKTSDSGHDAEGREEEGSKDPLLAEQLQLLLEEAIKKNLERLAKTFQERHGSVEDELWRLDSSPEQQRLLKDIHLRCNRFVFDIGKLLDPSRKDGSYTQDVQANIFGPFVTAILETPPLFFVSRDRTLKMSSTQRKRYALTFPEGPSSDASSSDVIPWAQLKLDPNAMPYAQSVCLDINMMRDDLLKDAKRTRGPFLKAALLKKSTSHWMPLTKQCISKFKRYLQANVEAAVTKNFTGNTAGLRYIIGECLEYIHADVLQSFLLYVQQLMKQEQAFLPSNHPNMPARRMEVLRHLAQERFSSKPPRRHREQDPVRAADSARDRAMANRVEVETPRTVRLANMIASMPDVQGPPRTRTNLRKRAASEPPTTPPAGKEQETHQACKRVRFNKDDAEGECPLAPEAAHGGVNVSSEGMPNPAVSAGVVSHIDVAAIDGAADSPPQAGPSRLPMQTGSQQRQANARRKFERTASEPLAIINSFAHSPLLVPSPVLPSITVTEATPPARADAQHDADDMVLSTPDSESAASPPPQLLQTPATSPTRAAVAVDVSAELMVDGSPSEGELLPTEEDEASEDDEDQSPTPTTAEADTAASPDPDGRPFVQPRPPRRPRMSRPQRTSLPVQWLPHATARMSALNALKSAAADSHKSELHFFADVGAEYSLAAQRLVDSVPAAILLQYGQVFVARLMPALRDLLGLEDLQPHARGEDPHPQESEEERAQCRAHLEAQREKSRSFLARIQAAMGDAVPGSEGSTNSAGGSNTNTVPFPSVSPPRH